MYAYLLLQLNGSLQVVFCVIPDAVAAYLSGKVACAAFPDEVMMRLVSFLIVLVQLHGILSAISLGCCRCCKGCLKAYSHHLFAKGLWMSLRTQTYGFKHCLWPQDYVTMPSVTQSSMHLDYGLEYHISFDVGISTVVWN